MDNCNKQHSPKGLNNRAQRLVLSGCLSTAVFFAQSAQTRTGSAEGVVVNSATRGSVGNAEVSLQCLVVADPLGCQPRMLVKARADGHFRFDSLRPGSYLLIATAPGFTLAMGAVPTVNVEAASVASGTEVKMDPEARIQGRVVDETGNPAADLEVTALREKHAGISAGLEESAKVRTSGAGLFDFLHLSPGIYYLAVTLPGPKPHAGPGGRKASMPVFRMFFPSSLYIDQATPLHLGTGQSLAGLSIKIRAVQGHKIEGQVKPLPKRPEGDQLALELSGPNLAATLKLPLDEEGAFQAEDLLPGSYALRLVANASLPIPGSAAPSRTRRLLVEEPVDVSNRDIEGILVVPIVPIPLTIAVAGDDEWLSKLENTVKVTLSPEGEGGSYGGQIAATIGSSQNATVPQYPPLQYRLQIQTPKGFYVSSTLLNGNDTSNIPLDLRRGTGGALNIRVRSDGGAVTGRLLTSAADAGSVSVFLMPQGLSPNTSYVPSILTTDVQNNRFQLADVPPGQYRIAAVATPSPDVGAELVQMLISNGKLVTVEPRSRLNLELTLLPSDGAADR